jgi:hypothetical protein
MVRIEYGLFKGLQKLASKLPEEMNPKDAKALEKAQKGAQQRAEKFLAKSQKKMDAHAKKKLGRFTAYGLKIEFKGPIHEGNITFKITNNYLNRRGEELDVKGFKAFTAEASNQKKDYAKYMAEAMKEVEALSNLSSLVYEGKGKVPKNVPALALKVAKNVLSLLGIASMISFVQVAVSNMLYVFGGFSIIGMLGTLGILVGAGLTALLINKVRQYGFKDAFNYFKLQTREVSEGVNKAVQKNIKVASARPSVDYQVGLIISYRY